MMFRTTSQVMTRSDEPPKIDFKQTLMKHKKLSKYKQKCIIASSLPLISYNSRPNSKLQSNRCKLGSAKKKKKLSDNMMNRFNISIKQSYEKYYAQ